MSYLKHVTDEEFHNLQANRPQVFYIGEKDNGFIRYAAPEGCTFLDDADGSFTAADTDFLIKEE